MMRFSTSCLMSTRARAISSTARRSVGDSATTSTILASSEHLAGARFLVGAPVVELTVGALQAAVHRRIEGVDGQRRVQELRGFFHVAAAEPGVTERGVGPRRVRIQLE